MNDSPCHYCPKCPCKEHDTCKDYQDYRRGRFAMYEKKNEERAVMDAACRAIRRCKKKGRR